MSTPNKYFIFPPSPRNANVNAVFGALTQLGGVLDEDFVLTYDNTHNAVVQVSEELYAKWRDSQKSEAPAPGLGVDLDAFNATPGGGAVADAAAPGDSTAASASPEPEPEPAAKAEPRTPATTSAKKTTTTRSGK